MDLKFALKLPPEKVQKYFNDKGYKFSWDWHEVYEQNHVKAFTVAKVMRADILQDIRTEMQKAIDEGLPFAAFQKNLEPKLKAKGWWGKHWIMDEAGTAKQVQLGSLHRLKTIYQNNIQSAYMAGRYKEMKAAVKYRPFWQYQAKMDQHTRPSHAALNGKVFAHDDPFWDTHYPPNGWNCRCRVRPLSEDQMREKGLTAENSEARLIESEIEVGGKKRKITTYQAGKGQLVSPDPGWNYNVGKASYKTDKTKYDSSIFNSYNNSLKAKTIDEAEKVAKNFGVIAKYSDNLGLANISNEAISDLRLAGYYHQFNINNDFETFKTIKVDYKGKLDDLWGFANVETNTVHLNSSLDWSAIAKEIKADFADNKISTDSPKHILLHECGHLLHLKNLSQLTNIILDKYKFTEAEKALIQKELGCKTFIVSVSLTEQEHNRKQNLEFVAEVFAGMVSGKTYSKEIMNLYNGFGGI